MTGKEIKESVMKKAVCTLHERKRYESLKNKRMILIRTCSEEESWISKSKENFFFLLLPTSNVNCRCAL